MANASYPISGRLRQSTEAASSDAEYEAWMAGNRERNTSYDATPKTLPTPEQMGAEYAKAQAGFDKGVASVTPAAPVAAAAAATPAAPAAAAPRPVLPDQARYGVMQRTTDGVAGKFIGVGANGQANNAFDTYEGAREFSQNQRAQPQKITPAVNATATSPYIPAKAEGPAPTSLPYEAPLPGAPSRGFRASLPPVQAPVAAVPSAAAVVPNQTGAPIPPAKEINAAVAAQSAALPVAAPVPAATPVNTPGTRAVALANNDEMPVFPNAVKSAREKAVRANAEVPPFYSSQTSGEENQARFLDAIKSIARPFTKDRVTQTVDGKKQNLDPTQTADSAETPEDLRSRAGKFPANSPSRRALEARADAIEATMRGNRTPKVQLPPAKDLPSSPQMFAERTPPYPYVTPAGSNRPSARLFSNAV